MILFRRGLCTKAGLFNNTGGDRRRALCPCAIIYVFKYIFLYNTTEKYKTKTTWIAQTSVINTFFLHSVWMWSSRVGHISDSNSTWNKRNIQQFPLDIWDHLVLSYRVCPSVIMFASVHYRAHSRLVQTWTVLFRWRWDMWMWRSVSECIKGERGMSCNVCGGLLADEITSLPCRSNFSQ